MHYSCDIRHISLKESIQQASNFAVSMKVLADSFNRRRESEMNKTFFPNSAVHNLLLSSPPRKYFLYLTVLLWHFPLLLPCFLYLAALSILFRSSCSFFHSPFLSYLASVGVSGKNPTDLCAEGSLGNIGMSLSISATTALQLWHFVMPALGRLRNKNRQSFLPPLPSAGLSPFPDTHSCWIITAHSCALVCSWIQFKPLRKQPEERKEGGEGKPSHEEVLSS